MPDIRMAHMDVQGIDVAVFDADSPEHTDEARKKLLEQLTRTAVRKGFLVSKAALAYRRDERTHYFGSPDLVRHLLKVGPPRWTHKVKLG